VAPPPPADNPPADPPASDAPIGLPTAPPAVAKPAAPTAATATTPCARRQWLHGSPTRPRVLLLNLTRAKVLDCLGKPTTKTAARGGRPELWTYGRGLELRLRAGRVSDYTLRDSSFASSGRQAGVGSSLQTLRRDLPGLRRDPRGGLQRALLRRTDGRYADIRVRAGAGGKIQQIVVTLRTRAGLDSFGRSLLRVKGTSS
jgi:hypothetical protein